MISVTDLRSGTVFEEKGQYFLVLSYEHIKMGRGSGTVKVKVRNLGTQATIEKTFVTGARIAEANLARRKVQYLYQNGLGFHLMDMATFDQFAVPKSFIDTSVKFLKEGMEFLLLMVGNKLVAVELPKIVEYKVIQTGGSTRGNTVGASYKDAVLENGLVVKVPLFIKSGEVIRVDTRSGQYVERAK